jgi:phosphoribosyl 1,2-cyclic phosphodiesterase
VVGVKLWMLGSGSDGNAVLVESGEERILIDVGFGPRILAGRLKAAGATPESISACFVTHEHSDHICGVRRATRKWRWPVYASPGTAASPAMMKVMNVTPFAPGTSVILNRLVVESIRTPHDAAESVGYVITESSTGVRAAIFYDIGHVSESIHAACANVDLLVIEANHDEGMLRAGPYPPWLQARIASNTGHLSNRSAGALISQRVSPTLNHVVLAHLSQQNNDPEVALATVRAALKRTRFRGTVTAAAQGGVVGPFVPRASRAEPPSQMELGL